MAQYPVTGGGGFIGSALTRALLDYEPGVSFEDGLRRTVQWYHSNPAARATDA